ncbi:MAG: glutamate--tRNA ligase [Bacteroidales bacterium]
MNEVRVRFAPSPTGPLHIGGLRTALFNYLFAKKHGGTFILRIEDTDRSRFVEGAEEYIRESLEWCGIIPDEGPVTGGEHGPYRQSERRDKYSKYAEGLIASRHAYYAFDTPEALDRARKECEERKETFTYDAYTRMQMENSLTLSEKETRERIERGDPFVIRFKFLEGKPVEMEDLIRGDVTVDSSTLDDKILFKSDGMPTYHLANVVDDYEMKISHVIRGEEWLPSLPLHVSLYKALGWEAVMPAFAHLPLILKPDGKGKLSKRDGDKGGFPVFPLEWKDPKTEEVSSGYREEGYFPEACINILAFLGWNPGTEQELYTIGELVKDFELEKVGRSGSKFDPDKARWFNHQYLQQRPVEELAKLFQPVLKKHGVERDDQYVREVIALIRERATFVSEFWEQSSFFFTAPGSYDENVVKKRWKEETPGLLKGLSIVLKSIEPFEASVIEKKVKEEIESNGWGMGNVMTAWRLVMVGTLMGPSLSDMAAILGREEVLRRIEKGISEIG